VTRPLDERPHATARSALTEPLRHDQDHRQRRGDHGEQRVRQATGADPTRTRQKPGRTSQERPPQGDPRLGAGIGEDVGAVAERTTSGGRRPKPTDDRGEYGGEAGKQPTGRERVAHTAVAGEQREGDQGEAQHRGEGGEGEVATGKPPAPMHARAEPVGVWQPGAPEGTGARGSGFERLQLERPRGSHGRGDADKLVGGAAHAKQANCAAGQLRVTSPSRPCKLFRQRDGNQADELEAG
jgi:hypothetical protein